MRPKDKVYNLILNYRLPVSLNNESINIFLKKYFEEYIQSIENASRRDEDCTLRQECYDLLNTKKKTISKLCKDILKVLEYYDSANMRGLYDHFNDMMSEIEPYLYIRDTKYRNYYRIREGEQEFSRLDMFHIPMSKRQLIRSYRYSIPGYPCLYLSTGLELCWFECGMPKSFSYSSFILNEDKYKELRLINFAIQPVDLVSSMRSSYINSPEDSKRIDEFIVNYLITFPLRVACSIQVNNRNVGFIQEYIFPQQLLLWIRENNNFDGIAYTTSSSIEEARKWNYINIVIPARELEGNYCKRLNTMFTVSKPEKIRISNIIKRYREEIKYVGEFVRKIENKYYNEFPLYPYREILSMCKTFLLLCELLETESYSNQEVIYQMIDTLNLFAYLIEDNQLSIKTKSIKDGKNILYKESTETIEESFEQTMEEFFSKIKPILFNFWSYIGRMTVDAQIDNTSYQHVLDESK